MEARDETGTHCKGGGCAHETLTTGGGKDALVRLRPDRTGVQVSRRKSEGTPDV